MALSLLCSRTCCPRSLRSPQPGLRYISLLREYRPDGVDGRRRSGTLAIELRRSRVLADAARPVVITTREACREQFRRTLGLPEPAVQALRALRESQAG